jgi:hypothetical protein
MGSSCDHHLVLRISRLMRNVWVVALGKCCRIGDFMSIQQLFGFIIMLALLAAGICMIAFPQAIHHLPRPNSEALVAFYELLRSAWSSTGGLVAIGLGLLVGILSIRSD